MPQRSILLLALVPLFLCVSCTARRPACPIEDYQQIGLAAQAVLQTRTPSAQELLSVLTARRQALTSLRGLARVTYAGPHDKGTARQAIAVAAPDRFRFDLFSPLGLVATTTCNGKVLSAYFSQENVVYRGQADPFTIARFTRVLLSAQEITALLLGVPALPLSPASAATPRVSFDAEHNWYRLELSFAQAGRHLLWFEPTTHVLRQWQRWTDEEQMVTQVHFGAYKKIQQQEFSFAFPFEIHLSDIHGSQEVGIYYEQVELVPPLADDLFRLGAISGAQVVLVDPGNQHPVEQDHEQAEQKESGISLTDPTE
jgi:outer membrane lipoprotein-sorting protein